MGIVGKFINPCSRFHSPLMRAVLDKPLAPLNDWIDFDSEGQPCGCLIGTAALAAGFKPHWDIEDEECRLPWQYLEDQLHLVGLMEVGVRVAEISARLAMGPAYRHTHLWDSTPASDERVVHMMRQRIARELAVTESALGVVGTLPNEPAEPSPTAARARPVVVG